MKKILIFFLIAIMLIVSSACSDALQQNNTENGSSSNIEETVEEKKDNAVEDDKEDDGNEENKETDGEEDISEKNEFFTVIFDTNGGSQISNQSIKSGDKVIKPKDPTKVGTGNTIYEFKGWFIGDVEYNFNNAVERDITLVAKWKESPYSDFVS